MLVIKVMKYNGGIVFQVFPVSQQTEEDTSPVDLFSTLKNLTVGADGDGGKIKDLISDNNEQGMESKVLYKIVKYKEIGCFDPCPITGTFCSFPNDKSKTTKDNTCKLFIHVKYIVLF